jgi:rare lipoprotein A
MRVLSLLAPVCLIAFLSGCMSDPAPKPQVRVSGAPLTTKRQPAPASIGKPAVQPASRGVQRGTASYYGDAFKGKPTASGEPFDPRGLTAAHKNLPFGTKVRVTTTDTKKSVVVRVNDRFPGTKGRVIDLSEAAFERIAPKARGVVEVDVEVVK